MHLTDLKFNLTCDEWVAPEMDDGETWIEYNNRVCELTMEFAEGKDSVHISADLCAFFVLRGIPDDCRPTLPKSNLHAFDIDGVSYFIKLEETNDHSSE